MVPFCDVVAIRHPRGTEDSTYGILSSPRTCAISRPNGGMSVADAEGKTGTIAVRPPTPTRFYGVSPRNFCSWLAPSTLS